MNSRFTIKDFFLFVLMIGVIIAISLSMAQFNYQEKALVAVRKQLGQNRQVELEMLSALQRLSRGGIAARSTSSRVQAGGPRVIRKHYKGGGEYVYYRNPPLPPHPAQEQPGYAQGDWLVLNLGTEPRHLAPFVSQTAAGNVVAGEALETLTIRDPQTLRYEPWLAESYRISAGGRHITFRLRKNICFSDGVPITAVDVVYSYDTLMNPQINCAADRTYFSSVKGCRAVGRRTVVFTLKRYYFKSLEEVGGLLIIPKHVYQRMTPAQYNESKVLVGSGAYVLHSWKPGVDIVFTRNIHYWGPKPAFNRIVYKFIENPQAALQTFESQQLDTDGPTPVQWLKLKARRHAFQQYTHYRYANPGNGYLFIGYNELRPEFKDRKTRTALTMLLNRKAIIKVFLKNLAIPVNGPFSPGTPQYDTNVKSIPYSVAGARKLLYEAGWRKNADGFLERAGKVFHFTLIEPTQQTTLKKISTYARQQFRRAGIRMSILGLQFSILDSKLRHHNFDAAFLGWTGGFEQDPKQIWASSSIANQGSNNISFRDPVVDKLIHEGRHEMDTAKRMAIWHAVQRRIYYDQPYTFLFEGESLHLIQKRIHNTRPFKTGLDPGNWFVPAALQKYH